MKYFSEKTGKCYVTVEDLQLAEMELEEKARKAEEEKKAKQDEIAQLELDYEEADKYADECVKEAIKACEKVVQIKNKLNKAKNVHTIDSHTFDELLEALFR